MSQRAVTVQIKDKAKIDDTYFDSCSLPDGRARDGSGEGFGGGLVKVGKKSRGRGMGRWWLSYAMASRGLLLKG